MNETHSILQRMRELAVQAGNDTNTESDRKEIQKEINQMTSEINRIGNTTQFNEMDLLDGTKSIIKTGNTNLTTATAITKDDAPAGLTGDVTAIGEYTGDADVTVTLSFEESSGKWSYKVGDGNEIDLTGDTFEVDGVKFDKSGLTGTGTGDGSYSYELKTATDTEDKSLTFQIGANEKQSISVDISDMRAKALGLTTTGTGTDLGVTDGTSNEIKEQALSVLTHDDAAETVTKIQSAIDQVSAERSKLGANQNRLEHTINNLNTSSENLTAAESRIRDVDYALAA